MISLGIITGSTVSAFSLVIGLGILTGSTVYAFSSGISLGMTLRGKLREQRDVAQLRSGITQGLSEARLAEAFRARVLAMGLA